MTARNLLEAELEGNHAAGAILLEQSLVDVQNSSCLLWVADQEANVAITCDLARLCWILLGWGMIGNSHLHMSTPLYWVSSHRQGQRKEQENTSVELH